MSFSPRHSGPERPSEVRLTTRSLPGAPASIKTTVQYTCEASEGAAIITRGDVTCSRLKGNPDTEAKRWVERNIEGLVSKGDIECIKKKGLWLVTKTHHVAEVGKAVFQSRGSQASFDAGVEVRDVTNAKASAAWRSSESGSSGFEKQRVCSNRPRYPNSRLTDM